MTETLISLISILLGIIGAHIAGFIFKKYSFGFIGSTIAGVFGSIFLIKAFGRLGFDPVSIMRTGELNSVLFGLNIAVSLFGGAMGLIAAKLIKSKLNQ